MYAIFAFYRNWKVIRIVLAGGTFVRKITRITQSIDKMSFYWLLEVKNIIETKILKEMGGRIKFKSQHLKVSNYNYWFRSAKLPLANPNPINLNAKTR